MKNHLARDSKPILQSLDRKAYSHKEYLGDESKETDSAERRSDESKTKGKENKWRYNETERGDAFEALNTWLLEAQIFFTV